MITNHVFPDGVSGGAAWPGRSLWDSPPPRAGRSSVLPAPTATEPAPRAVPSKLPPRGAMVTIPGATFSPESRRRGRRESPQGTGGRGRGACLHVCVGACTCVCACGCMCVSVCMCVHMCGGACAHVCEHCMWMLVCACVCVCGCMRVGVCMCVWMPVCACLCVCMCMNACM